VTKTRAQIIMENTTTKSATVTFFTIEEFKAKMNLIGEKAQVVKSPLTQKLFLSIGSSNFKCQQDIDGKKEMKVLVDNNDLSAGCLVNIKETADNVLFAL